MSEVLVQFKQLHPNAVVPTYQTQDAAGMDLDWFWRGWFYGTDHVDISLDDVQWFKIDSRDPDVEKPLAKTDSDEENPGRVAQRVLFKTLLKFG